MTLRIYRTKIDWGQIFGTRGEDIHRVGGTGEKQYAHMGQN